MSLSHSQTVGMSGEGDKFVIKSVGARCVGVNFVTIIKINSAEGEGTGESVLC